MIGRKLGNYEIIDKLGEGGMGEVFRARDERLHRDVAIKMLPQSLAADPSLRARFEQEARALGALNHANIVTIYDVGVEDGLAYTVSELVDGETLRALLDRGPLPPRKAIDYAVQMAEGIAAAHALGIVHRDLKPENVMVTKSGQLKLLDFGLAKHNTPAAGDRTATIALSQPGTVMGTAGYMSPEQVRAEAVDARSDIFSFGVVLYEMIAGKRAFHSTSAIETMHAILNSEPPDIDTESTKLPPALATIVRRCLEKRPEQRFQSASDLAFALRSITNTNITGLQPAVAKAEAAKKSTGFMWPVAALAGGVALLASGYAFRAYTTKTTVPHYERVTFRKGYVKSARFTADGRGIVYTAIWEGGPTRLYQTTLGAHESRDLGVSGDWQVASVSSKDELALVSRDGSLQRMSLSGGAPRPVLEDVMDADWSPDGTSMAVLRRVNGIARIEYPIGTVLIEKLAWPLGTIRVSPDGNQVAFLSYVNGRKPQLQMVDRKGTRKPIAIIAPETQFNSWTSLSWTPDGKSIWFASLDPSDPQTLYAVDMQGKQRAVANLTGRAWFCDRSKDGTVLVGSGSLHFGIAGAGPGETVERDLSCLDQSILVGISNDGSTVLASVLGDSAGPKGSVYMRKTDGSPAVRVGDGGAYRLSPDGKSYSGYVLDEHGSRRFGLFPTGAGEARFLDIPGLERAVIYGWIDGDRKLLVDGPLKGKKWQCFAWDNSTSTLTPVCPEGVADSFAVYVSPDGKWVIHPSHGKWMIFPVGGGPARELQGVAESENPFGWTADSGSFYVQPSRLEGPDVKVWKVNATTGARTLWKELHVSKPIDSSGDFHLQVTPDGRAYAYNYSSILFDLYAATGLN